MTPAISVLVPAHDDGRYLDAALASIAAQTFGDFEVLIADDASADATPAIAEAWASRDPRFRLSRVESNLGMNRNWNRALGEARGDFVLKLDADDAMTPACLEILHGELAADRGVLFAACRTMDCDAELRPVAPFPGDRAFRLHGLDPEARRVDEGLRWLRLCFDDAQLWHSDAQMYRRTELVELGGWDERWFSSDTELILRGLATNRPVVHRPEIGILYRRRQGSGSDRERASGAMTFAGTMILLRALDANHRDLAPLDRALRQNWWRLWRLFLERRRQHDAAGPGDPTLTSLAAETARLAPPLAIRVEGSLRQLGWRLKPSARWAAKERKG